jgi:hypothetical protein
MKRLVTTGLLSLLSLGASAPPAAPVTFTSYAAQFDDFEARTEGMPSDQRVTEFLATFDKLMPGLYADKDPTHLARRIDKALTGFPSIRPVYRDVEREFPGALDTAVTHFRNVFPDFVPLIPIYLVHSLGIRDGGADFVNGNKVFMFGADVIARIHHDDSLPPFMDHELFHLEHARHFDDCDQLWCPLWQEGLATYAASVMTPGANDHQLLLDKPTAIRAETDAKWGDALCWVATRFDATDDQDMGDGFMGGQHPQGLPSRFGYYVGMRVAAEAAKSKGLPAITRLSDEQARPVVVKALGVLIKEAHAPCKPPAAVGPITHQAPRPA